MAEENKNETSVLWPLLKYLKPFWLPLTGSLLLLLFAKGIESSIPLFMGHLSKFLFGTGLTIKATKELVSKMAFGTMLMVLLIAFGFLSEAFSTYIRSKFAEKALYKLRSDVYQHILFLPLKYFDRARVGNLITRTIHDVDQINQLFSESLVPIIGNLVIFIGILIAVTYLSGLLALGVFTLLPFVFFLTNNFRIQQKRIYDRIRALVSEMNVFTQEHLAGMPVIRSFGLRERENKEFVKLNGSLKNAYLSAIHNFSFFVAGIDFMTSSFYILAFVLIALMSPAHNFNAPLYFSMSLYAAIVFRPLADLAERYNSLEAAFAGGRRVFQILKEKEEDQSSGITLDEPIKTIEFKDVYFAYNQEDFVLKGVSFKINEGEHVAFVGETGAGKSTLFSLLLGFYDYQKGSILINGKELKSISKKSLRKHFSIILQDSAIFSGTLKENITLFDENPDEKQVENALILSRLDKVFPNMSLNDPFDGKQLSSGEMQLIAFARAIYSNREVLLLDEATAHIDPKTEAALQKALLSALRGKTSLTIAHRLSTVEEVDAIFVMQNGQIVEKGNHLFLLELKGIYEKLYRLQFIPNISK